MHRLKLCIVLSLLVTCCAANEDGSAQVVQYEFDRNGDAQYRYSFETSNGIRRNETGEEIPSIHDASNNAALVKGSFSYTGADGVLYTVNYVADEAGFHPEGAHLMIPPFTPWIPGQPIDDGQYKQDNSGQYQPDNSGQYSPDNNGDIQPQVRQPQQGSSQFSPLRPSQLPLAPSTFKEQPQQPQLPFKFPAQQPNGGRSQFDTRRPSQFPSQGPSEYQSPQQPPQKKPENFITGERILNDYRSPTPTQPSYSKTPSPPITVTQEYLPTRTPQKTNYQSGENILDSFLPSRKPSSPVTTKYLPSSTPSYTSGENILDAFRESSRPTPKYLPSFTTAQPQVDAFNGDIIKKAFFNKPTPHPDVSSYSTPQDGKFGSELTKSFGSKEQVKKRGTRSFKRGDIDPEFRILGTLASRR